MGEVVKAIEYRERAHQSQRSQCHPTYGDSRNDVDGVVRLLGEEVATGYVKGTIHDEMGEITSTVHRCAPDSRVSRLQRTSARG